MQIHSVLKDMKQKNESVDVGAGEQNKEQDKAVEEPPAKKVRVSGKTSVAKLSSDASASGSVVVVVDGSMDAAPAKSAPATPAKKCS